MINQLINFTIQIFQRRCCNNELTNLIQIRCGNSTNTASVTARSLARTFAAILDFCAAIRDRFAIRARAFCDFNFEITFREQDD